jgi:hypothetical protein
MNRENESQRQDLYMSAGVMKDSKLNLRNLHASHTLGYWAIGTPKDRDEVNRRDVCECDGSPIDVFLKYHTYLDTSYLLTYLLNSWTCPRVIV